MNAFAFDTQTLPDHHAHPWACTCPPCRERRNRYKKNWRLNRHRGEPSTMVNPEPTLDRIRNHLLPAAWTRVQIGYAAGLDPYYIARMLGEQSAPVPPTIRADTQAAILALGPADRFRNVPGGAHLDPTGTRRRLQALAYKGYRIGELLDELRCNNNLANTAFVLARNARLVAGAYDRLWMTDGPSTVGAVRARRRGCVGPGAWDDWTIDDPRAVPDCGVERPISPAELLEEADRIIRMTGAGPDLVAERLGVKRNTLEKARERAAARVRAAGSTA